MTKTLPLQYKDERAYFMDFEFKVTRDTFIPRPETEILVETVLNLIRPTRWDLRGRVLHILDIGTGCGNIAISLTKYIQSSKITALDISERAISIATENALNYECLDRIDFIKSDLFANLNRHIYKNYFDMIVANPPYISLNDMDKIPCEVKAEPRQALYGGKDGLCFYRRIVREAPYFMKEKGILVMEVGYNQAARVQELMELSGFRNINVHKDYNGIERVAVAQWTN